MTVEIIAGPPEFIVTTKCGGCEATLKAKEVDFRIGVFGANYGGDTGEPGLYFVCPVCHFHVRFRHPASLLDKIRNRVVDLD